MLASFVVVKIFHERRAPAGPDDKRSDKMVGGEFEKGLADLKSVVEAAVKKEHA